METGFRFKQTTLTMSERTIDVSVVPVGQTSLPYSTPPPPRTNTGHCSGLGRALPQAGAKTQSRRLH